MLILVTNDDGINAPGIWALARAMQELGRVMIVAPSEEKSGTGHSITVHRPLRVEQVRSCDGLEAYVVNGTPADCVKLGMEGLSNESPNIVVSGLIVVLTWAPTCFIRGPFLELWKGPFWER